MSCIHNEQLVNDLITGEILPVKPEELEATYRFVVGNQDLIHDFQRLRYYYRNTYPKTFSEGKWWKVIVGRMWEDIYFRHEITRNVNLKQFYGSSEYSVNVAGTCGCGFPKWKEIRYEGVLRDGSQKVVRQELVVRQEIFEAIYRFVDSNLKLIRELQFLEFLWKKYDPEIFKQRWSWWEEEFLILRDEIINGEGVSKYIDADNFFASSDFAVDNSELEEK